MISRKTILCTLLGAWLIGMPVMAQKPNVASNNKERCQAKTKKGERCKLKVIEGSKFCSVHNAKDAKSTICKAITKKGTRCTRAAVKGGYCTQHYNLKKGK